MVNPRRKSRKCPEDEEEETGRKVPSCSMQRKVEEEDEDAIWESKTIEDLLKELELVRAGTHPKLLAKYEEFDKITAEALERQDIVDKLRMNQLEEEYRSRNEKINKAAEQKIRELKETMFKEIDALEKRYELEYSSIDITKPSSSAATEVNKKTLRGRGGILVEPPTYFNAPRTQVVSVQSTATFLLKESQILEDLMAINPNYAKSLEKNQRLYEVSIQRMKFTYDGKSYKQGEIVFVENNEYGKLPAKIENVSEAVVSFKGTQSWDTRQIHASGSDLVEGRVKVYKKKNN